MQRVELWGQALDKMTKPTWDHPLCFGELTTAEEAEWVIEQVKQRHWVSSNGLEVAAMAREIRSRMGTDNNNELRPADNDLPALVEMINRHYRPPMSIDDRRRWFDSSVSETNPPDDRADAMSNVIDHVLGCDKCNEGFDWSLQSLRTCERASVTLKEELRTLSTNSDSYQFANPRVFAAVHRLGCHNCQRAWREDGQICDWECDWGFVIAHIAGGLDLSRLRKTPKLVSPKSLVYEREVSVEEEDASAKHEDLDKAFKLCETNHAWHVGTFPLSTERSGKGRLCKSAEARLPGFTISPSFLTCKKQWWLENEQGQLMDMVELDELRVDSSTDTLQRVRVLGKKLRLVIDYKRLNDSYTSIPFSLRRLDDRALQWRAGDFLAVTDIKAAFTRVPLKGEFQKELSFAVKDPSDEVAQVFAPRHWAFGHKLSPLIFTLVATATTQVINQVFDWAGLPTTLDAYVDDLIMAAPTADQCATQLRLAGSWCKELGLPLSDDKSQGPAQRVEYLGRVIQTVPAVKMNVTDEKHRQLGALAKHVLTDGLVSTTAWTALVGVLINLSHDCSDAYGVPKAMGYAIYRTLAPGGAWTRGRKGGAYRLSQVRWGAETSRAMTCMMERLMVHSVRPSVPVQEAKMGLPLWPFEWVTASDSSDFGTGGFAFDLNDSRMLMWHASLGSMSKSDATDASATEMTSSTLREMVGLLCTLNLISEDRKAKSAGHPRHEQRGHTPVLFLCDNRGLIFTINRRAAHQRSIGQLLSLVLRFAEREQLVVVACHVPREFLHRADDLSRTCAVAEMLPGITCLPPANELIRRMEEELEERALV